MGKKYYNWWTDCYYEEEPMVKKPPLGVIPGHIWLENRRDDLRRAIKEYVDFDELENYDLVKNWLVELEEVNNQLRELS